MYLRHKSIQVMKEEQRREKEIIIAKEKKLIKSMKPDRERTLGGYIQFQRHGISPMKTYNPSYGGGASGIASGVSITAPPYRQPVIKESRTSTLRQNQILEQIQRYASAARLNSSSSGNTRPPNSRQLNR